MRFAWWPHTTSLAVASYRLRCANIVEKLRNDGLDVGIYRLGVKPEVLVLSKRYDSSSMKIAQGLRKNYGTRLILDLCDNHFYADSASPIWERRSLELEYAIETVDWVVASTESLAEVITAKTGNTEITVIGDPIELPFQPEGFFRLLNLSSELRLQRLHAKMARDSIPSGHRLVWYGNHGSGNAEGGMSDLNRLRRLLECRYRKLPCSLTVISNNRAKYRQTIATWSIPTYYLEWNLATFSRALKLHDVSVIPITLNGFTICKTNNRVVTALLHGLGVAVDPIPSYQVLADCVEIDNWQDGLIRLIEDEKYKKESIARGVEKINHACSMDFIVKRWLSVLKEEG